VLNTNRNFTALSEISGYSFHLTNQNSVKSIFFNICWRLPSQESSISSSFLFVVNNSGRMSSIEKGSLIQNSDVRFSGKYSFKSHNVPLYWLPVQGLVEFHFHWWNSKNGKEDTCPLSTSLIMKPSIFLEAFVLSWTENGVVQKPCRLLLISLRRQNISAR
jgi:hypothetical protein